MIVEIIYEGKLVTIPNFDLVLVKDNDGQPLAVASPLGNGGAGVVSSIDDDVRFQQVLHRLGINRTVFVNDISKSLKKPELLPRL
jgi:hypothetical protein